MEIELKLLIEKNDIKALKNHEVIKKYASQAPVIQQQEAIYFDSPDFHLKNSNLSLRVRKSSNEWTQTLKAGRLVSGLYERYEWENAVPSPALDLYALRNTIDKKGPWREMFASPKTAAELAPIFTTNIQRTRWDLQTTDGAHIELVLDQGTVEGAGTSHPICEIELELKSGNKEQLINIALALLKDIPMRPGYETKSAHGYQLHSQNVYAAVKTEPLELTPKMTIEQAFEAIIENCLRQIQANQAGVAGSNDIHCLHQMRVGLRRLKSALRMFNDVIELPEELKLELDWLGEQLGAARDWDVLATSTLPNLQLSDPVIEQIKQAAERKAEDMHEVAATALNSNRYARLILSLLQWLGNRDWRNSATESSNENLDKRLKPFSQRMLNRDRNRLINRGRDLQDADAHHRHRVRIAAKKLRYDTEFFRSIYSSKQTKDYVKALSKIQDELGLLNDIAVGEGLLLELQSEQKELASAASYVRGYLSAHTAEGKKKTRKLWKRFKANHLTK